MRRIAQIDVEADELIHHGVSFLTRSSVVSALRGIADRLEREGANPPQAEQFRVAADAFARLERTPRRGLLRRWWRGEP